MDKYEIRYAVVVGALFYCTPVTDLTLATAQYIQALKDPDNHGRTVKLIVCTTLKSKEVS